MYSPKRAEIYMVRGSTNFWKFPSKFQANLSRNFVSEGLALSSAKNKEFKTLDGKPSFFW